MWKHSAVFVLLLLWYPPTPSLLSWFTELRVVRVGFFFVFSLSLTKPELELKRQREEEERSKSCLTNDWLFINYLALQWLLSFASHPVWVFGSFPPLWVFLWSLQLPHSPKKTGIKVDRGWRNSCRPPPAPRWLAGWCHRILWKSHWARVMSDLFHKHDPGLLRVSHDRHWEIMSRKGHVLVK